MIIPLFPLHTSLFPGGRLPLKIFEARYMDMATACLKNESPFGVCLLADGEEVARPGQSAATPHEIGTLATIDEWDMPQLGVLHVNTQGSQRFRIRRSWQGAAALLQAEVELLPDEPTVAVPSRYDVLVSLLRAIIDETVSGSSSSPFQIPYRYDDASWVSMRLSEVLPVPALARQKLLEVDDGLIRMEIVYRILESQNLLPVTSLQ